MNKTVKWRKKSGEWHQKARRVLIAGNKLIFHEREPFSISDSFAGSVCVKK